MVEKGNKDSFRQTYLIGITGGSASGKTSVANGIVEALGEMNCSIMGMDNYYKPLTREELLHVSDYNFDHPGALDYEEIARDLKELLSGKDIYTPVYDFTRHARMEGKKEEIKWAPFIIFEGIHSLYYEELRDLMDLRLFVMTDDDIRLARRDIEDRGRNLESCLVQMNKFVKPAYDEYIKPTMKHTHIILPHGARNTIGTKFIFNNLTTILQKRTIKGWRNEDLIFDQFVYDLFYYRNMYYCQPFLIRGELCKYQLNSKYSSLYIQYIYTYCLYLFQIKCIIQRIYIQTV